MTDNVNNPPHYTSGSVECIDYMEQVLTPQEFVGYLRGSMIKYQHRMMLKGDPVENAEKAQWYNARLIATMKKLQVQ